MTYLIYAIKNNGIVVACGAKAEAQAAIADKGSVFTYIDILLIEKEALSVDKEAMSVDKRALSVDKRAMYVNKQALSVDKRALSVNKEAMSIDKRAMSVNKQAMSIPIAVANADTEFATLKEEFFLVKKAETAFKQAGCLRGKLCRELYALKAYLLKASEFV